MKQRLLIIFLGVFLIGGCKINRTNFTAQEQKTEPVSMPAEAFSKLRIVSTGPVNIRFTDNESATADPHAIIETEVTVHGIGYEKEEIDAIMQQAIDSFDDNFQLSFSVSGDVCTVTVAFDPENSGLIEEHSMMKYFYSYPDITLVLLNVSALEIEAQTKGKITAEVDLAGAVLKSTEDRVTFSALTGSSISASSIIGDSLNSSILTAKNGITIDSATDTTITAANSVIAEALERVTIQAKDISADSVDNATIVATGKVSIGTAGGKLAVKTAGGSITVDEFYGDWFNMRQITNRSAYSSAADITMFIAGEGVVNGLIKTDSGDVVLDLLDRLSCTVDLTATQGSIDITGIDSYTVRNDDNPDDWAQFILSEGDGSLTVLTDTGDIDIEVADMFFPWP